MSVFIGPAWNADGSPELVRGLGRAPSQRHKRATLLIIDDYGNAVAYRRRCPGCRRWKPLSFEHFNPASTTNGMGMQSMCIPCALAAHRLAYRRDPEAKKAAGRRRYREAMQDPKRREALRRANLRNIQSRKERDAEKFADERREAQRRYKEKMYADSERAARYRETQRMGHRLRAERRRAVQAAELRVISTVSLPRDGAVGYIPALPLHDALERAIEQVKGLWSPDHTDELSPRARVCARAGIYERQLYAWSPEGDIDQVRFDTADRVLTNMGWFWWEIWPPGTDGHEQARRAFEGEEEIAA